MLAAHLGTVADPSEAVTVDLGRSAQRGKLIDRINNSRFIENHIWDKLIGYMKVEVSVSRKYVLSADNFQGTLGELLYKNLFRASAKKTYWLEIYITKISEAVDPFAPSLALRQEDLEKYELLVKMKMIEDRVTHNDKMNLKKVLEIYILNQDQSTDHLESDTNLLTQSKLFNIAYFVAKRIFDSAKDQLLRPEDSTLAQENTLSRKYYFKDKFESKMKLNSRIVGWYYPESRSQNRARIQSLQPYFAF